MRHKDTDKRDKFSYRGILCILLTICGGLQYGWNVTSLNVPSFDNVEDCARVLETGCVVFPNHSRTEWIFSINAWVVGGAIGALCSWHPANVYGRRITLLLCGIFGIFGGLIQCFSFSIKWLIAGRFLSGVASGGYASVGSVYLAEISPAYLRGSIGCLMHVSIVCSACMASATAYVFGGSNTWRSQVGMSMVPSAIQVVIGVFAFVESPRWLMLMNRRQDANRALQVLYESSSNWYPEVLNFEIAELKNRQNESIFQWKYKKQLIIAAGMTGFNKSLGLANIHFFSSEILRDTGIADARLGTLLIQIVNVVASITAVAIIDRFSRRKVLLCTSMGVLFALSVITFAMIAGYPLLMLFGIFIFVACFDFGPGPLVWITIAEIFPNHTRARAQGFGSFILWTTFCANSFCFPYVFAAIESWSFLPFVIISALFLLFVYCYIPETRNMNLEDIQAELFSGKDEHKFNKA